MDINMGKIKNRKIERHMVVVFTTFSSNLVQLENVFTFVYFFRKKRSWKKSPDPAVPGKVKIRKSEQFTLKSWPHREKKSGNNLIYF